jgi:hypothetical protein
MQLTGIGRTGAVQPVLPGSDEVNRTRLDIVRPGYDEWYVSRDIGIEQGMTLPTRLGGDGPLTVSYAVSGTFKPYSAGQTVIFFDNTGPVMQYGGLKALDATGRMLPATLALSGTMLSWQIDDRNAVYPVTIDPYIVTQTATLTAPDAAAYARFGDSVAVYNDTAVIGDYEATVGSYTFAGEAYVFKNSGGTWSQVGSPLTASDAAANADFGESVAVYNDTAVIGAGHATVGSNTYAGEAYVFKNSGNTWSQVGSPLTSSDTAAYAYFGHSVAVYNDTAVIGDYEATVGGYTYAGKAYVFTNSGGTWSQVGSPLTASDAAANAYFGGSVAVWNDTAVIGAYGANSYVGKAYVFTNSGGTWSQVGSPFTASDAAANAYFGNSVAVWNDTAVIGANLATVGSSYTSAGEVYVFKNSGGTWSQVGSPLTASDAAANADFGESVAVYNDTAVVGAGDANSNAGEAYVFKNSGGTWSQIGSPLTASDAAANAWFGGSVAVYNDTAVVGAEGANTYAGKAYVFTITVAVPPSVTGVTPASGPTAGGTPVTVTGSGFTGATSVSFGGTVNATGAMTVNSDTSITVTAPSHSEGTMDVTVTTAAGTSSTSSADTFTYVAPPPTVSGITPASGGNTTTVSITNLAGTNFVSGATAMLTPSNSNPVHKGSIINAAGGALLGDPWSVYVSGNYAYVASAGSNALEIVDVSNPVAPVHKGSIVNGNGGALLNEPWSVYVFGNYAYVASYGSNALEIVDVSNPAAPVHKGSIVDGTGGALLNGAQSVYVSGNYAYVASANSDALEIVDVSNPANPVHKGSIVNGEGGALLIGPDSVYVSRNYAYVASASSSDLEIVDVSNPALPVHKGSIVNGAGGAFLGEPDSVYVSGNYAYVASVGGSNALEIVDVSDPANPVHKGSIQNGAGGAFLNNPQSVYVSGNYVYVASSNSNSLEIVDVSNPALPVHKGSIQNGEGGALLYYPISVYVSGNYAYVVSRDSSSLEIVDVGTVTGTSVAWLSSTQMTCTFDLTNKIAGLYNVVVTNPDGSFGTLANGFTVNVPFPVVTGLSLHSGSIAGGDSVTITGSGFTGATEVDFGTGNAVLASSFTSITDTQIILNSPPDSAGQVDVTVITPSGTSATSSKDHFTYETIPTVTAVSPTAGPADGGNTVTITGTDLWGATEVDFGPNPGSDVTVDETTGTSLTVTTPAGSGTVDVLVTTRGGTSSPNAPYDQYIYGAPIASFSANPTSGSVPLTVQFTDSSTGSPNGWAWFFGDENYGASWTQVSGEGVAPWPARYGQSSVVMPDGSIVLMGGNNGLYLNDVWQSWDDGASWTQVSGEDGAPWSGRYGQSSVVMPDGSIVLMGGTDGSTYYNDVWQSWDDGATWTQVSGEDGAPWSGRYGQSSVVMPDGSIILMGGWSTTGGFKNDVWQSQDDGATWTQVDTSSSPSMWTPRYGQSSVVMPDGSIILMGGLRGFEDGSYYNDVWQSWDDGATWTRVNVNPGWSGRYGQSSVVMPDGSIVLMGGFDSNGPRNDGFRSPPGSDGLMFEELLDAGWPARAYSSSVAMPDGSIVLMGGTDGSTYYNDVWQLTPAGSTSENPSHTYTTQGRYPVALEVYNSVGYNSTLIPGYITVNEAPPVASFTATPISGTAPRTIQFTDTSTNTPTSWEWSFGNGDSSTLQSPQYIYFSPSDYSVSLTVSNSAGSDTVTRTDYITLTQEYETETYNFLSQWGSDTHSAGKLNAPEAVAVDGSGNTYVADTYNNRIEKYDSSGTYVTQWGIYGCDDGQFSSPQGIVVNASGYVYVADSGNSRIQVFTPTGTYVTQWGYWGSDNSFFEFPDGIATDAAGNVYVADRGNSRIQVFTPSGIYVTQWGTPGSGDGQFNNPNGIAVNASGYVYVADSSNSRIQVFTPTGTYVTQWGYWGSDNGYFEFPEGIATDAAGNVYVTDSWNDRIQKFSPSGTYVTQWGAYGIGDGQFQDPEGIAIDSAGNFYVADTRLCRIQKFSSSGTYLAQWGSNLTGNGQFQYPEGITTDSAGNVYVADTFNNRIQKFSSSGAYITQWGTPGIGDGQFSSPQGIVVNASGYVYIADSGNYRIQVFTPTGTYVTQWGTPGIDDGQFQYLAGVAVDTNGNVYVVDGNLCRIQKFGPSGAYLTQWGSYGNGEGQFVWPYGIAVDTAGYVYVADTYNNRIQKFSSSGTYITQWGTPGIGDGQFSCPNSIAADAAGNIYVTDSDNTRIQKFDSTGTYLAKWGTSGYDDGQFNAPSGVAVDTADTVYVADSGNHRIQTFAQQGNSMPVSSFTATATSGTAPLTVQFNDTSGTFSPLMWNWSFGDTSWFNTTTIATSNASHVYTSAGSYTVSLTITNATGSNTATQTGYITVTIPAPTVASITPASGVNTTTVSITNLAGTNFQSGASVLLTPVNVNPVHKGSIINGAGGALLNDPNSVYVSGNYAYVASSNSNALEIVDVSNPANPVHKGCITDNSISGSGALLNDPVSVYVSGNNAYVASSNSNALEIVDVSNPANPVHKGSIVDGTGGARLNDPVSVYVSGNYAYVASLGSDALEIVDVSNPANPVHKGSIVDGAGGARLNDPHSVYVSGNYAYVASYDSNALEIVDVSNPASPVHKGSIVDGAGGALLAHTESVYVSGNYAYVVSSGSNALEIVDVSNPASPVHKGSIVDGAGGARLQWPLSIYVSGNYAYIASWQSEALEIVDISNPANPVHKGSIVDGTGGALLNTPHSVYVSGNYAYVGSVGSNALEIVDVGTVTGTSVAWLSSTQMTCMFDLTHKIAGLYNVVVTNPDRSFGTLANGLTVTSASAPTITGVSTASGTAPIASFTATPTSGTVPLTVQFTDTSTTSTGSITNWSWNFGDGNTSIQENPVNTFSWPQVFNITLTVTGSTGLANSTMQQITVYAPPTIFSTQVNGTTAMTVSGVQSLQVSNQTIENTNGNVTSTATTLTVQNASTFWQSAQVFAQSVSYNTATSNYDVQNVNQVILQSTPVTANLSQSIGNVSVSLNIALNQYVSNAAVNVAITQGANTSTMQGFQLAATNANINVKSVAYTVELSNTDPINTNLINQTTNATQAPHAVVITMNVNHDWVTQFDNGANNYGRGAIDIIRYPSTGSPQVLTTRFDYYDPSTNLDWFEADSPNGLSIFGLVEYAAQQAAASNSRGVQPVTPAPTKAPPPPPTVALTPLPSQTGTPVSTSTPAPLATAGPPPVPTQPPIPTTIIPSMATLKTDKSGRLTAALGVQSTDKTALLTLPQNLRATDAAGHILSEVNIQPLASSLVPATDASSGDTFSGPVYMCGPDGAQFSPAIALTITLTDAQWTTLNANGREPVIRAYTPETGSWQTLTTGSDATTHTLTASVSHFTDFAVFDQPVPQTSASTPLSAPTDPYDIMLSMLVWTLGMFRENLVIAAVCVGMVCAVPISWWWYRRKKQYDIIFGRRY